LLVPVVFVVFFAVLLGTVMNSAIHAEKVSEIIVSGTAFGTVINIVSK